MSIKGQKKQRHQRSARVAPVTVTTTQTRKAPAALAEPRRDAAEGRAQRLALAAAIVSVLSEVHRAAALVLVLELARAVAVRPTVGPERCAELVADAIESIHVLHPVGSVDLQAHARALCAVWWWSDMGELETAVAGSLGDEAARVDVDQALLAEEEVLLLLNPPPTHRVDQSARVDAQRRAVVRAILLSFEPDRIGSACAPILAFAQRLREVGRAYRSDDTKEVQDAHSQELQALADACFEVGPDYGVAALFGVWWPDGPFTLAEDTASGRLCGDVIGNEIMGDLLAVLPGLYASEARS